jgi:hypothetical protein
MKRHLPHFRGVFQLTLMLSSCLEQVVSGGLMIRSEWLCSTWCDISCTSGRKSSTPLGSMTRSTGFCRLSGRSTQQMNQSGFNSHASRLRLRGGERKQRNRWQFLPFLTPSDTIPTISDLSEMSRTDRVFGWSFTVGVQPTIALVVLTRWHSPNRSQGLDGGSVTGLLPGN